LNEDKALVDGGAGRRMLAKVTGVALVAAG